MQKYNHQKIEKKWQEYWRQRKTFQAKDFSKKKKKFILFEFPYPSGAGLHVGHMRPYVATDIYARFNRLLGREVLYPMGWDAFGLPAENYAIKMGLPPRVTTKKNIANAKRQMEMAGISLDWSREINTTDPDYYKWTQWLFLQFYKAGLAYEATGLINWCPKDKTGLANEEVIDGKCERSGTAVEKKELRQWYLKITAYAEKLLEGLQHLPEWPEAVKLQQENWIGKSTGAEIDFPLSGQWTVNSGQKPNFLILHGYTGRADKNFLPWLKMELEKQGYAAQVPQMPNTEHPKESEQVEYVLKNCRIDKNTVIVGHSLGAVVAMKVLQKVNKPVKGLYLIAPAIERRFHDADSRPFWKDFSWEDLDYEKLKSLASTRYVLSDLKEAYRKKYLEFLSEKLDATLVTGEAKREHFCALQEPIILDSLLPTVKVFTTRPDTLFGVTYLVVAPEHPVVENLKSEISNFKEVQQYLEKTKQESEIERTAKDKEKTGVELKGVWVSHPAKPGVKLSVWVADYVLMGYGTGAIMAVPGHDERDFAFAKKYNIPIRCVVRPKDDQEFEDVVEGKKIYGGEGVLVNSFDFDGLTSAEARTKITAAFGKPKVQYKLRDWVFSRQRYWGEPIPIIHCGKCGIVPVPEKDLPVRLPPVKKYEPTGTGESPLAAIAKWVNVKCPKCGEKAKRETNTMPQWAGSSWYWLRYTDPHNKKIFADKKKQKYWTPVEMYFGGMEHTTLHLLYSRFWNLFLYDQKLVTAKEPYTKRVPHGSVLAADGSKMSKSRGNVVSPDDIARLYGADTLRMYEMFLGPYESTVAWNDQGIVGVRRFLERIWIWGSQIENSKFKIQNESEQLKRELNKLIKKITEDIENFHFNTAISAFMEFHNQVRQEQISKESLRKFLVLLYPFAPHMCEELNFLMGNKKSLQLASWPKFDPKKIVEPTVEIVVQVNGKVKGKMTVPAGSDQALVQAEAVKIGQVTSILKTDSIKRVVYVPNRLINLVV